MGSAILDVLTPKKARAELAELKHTLGCDLEQARLLSCAGLLTDEQEAARRRAEELTWLLEP
ncbi:hypothetical protein GCM10027030_05430 [Luteococcus sediminum]